MEQKYIQGHEDLTDTSKLSDTDLLCKILEGYSDNYGEDDLACFLASLGLTEKELEDWCDYNSIEAARKLGYLE